MKKCFSGHFKVEINRELTKKKINAYSLYVALSNKYLEVIIRCLELMFFNERVKFYSIFFYFIE